jgi:hypothetical protein
MTECERAVSGHYRLIVGLSIVFLCVARSLGTAEVVLFSVALRDQMGVGRGGV